MSTDRTIGVQGGRWTQGSRSVSPPEPGREPVPAGRALPAERRFPKEWAGCPLSPRGQAVSRLPERSGPRDQSRIAVASTSTSTSGSKRYSTPMREAGGMGAGRPISFATASTPAMKSPTFSGAHWVT